MYCTTLQDWSKPFLSSTPVPNSWSLSKSKFCEQSKYVILHAIILGIVLGSNETIEIFVIPRELTCSLEREDKELETGTFSISTRNISEAKIAFWDLHRKDSIIEIHIYILFSLQLQLTVLRLPRKHATG